MSGGARPPKTLAAKAASAARTRPDVAAPARTTRSAPARVPRPASPTTRERLEASFVAARGGSENAAATGLTSTDSAAADAAAAEKLPATDDAPAEKLPATDDAPAEELPATEGALGATDDALATEAAAASRSVGDNPGSLPTAAASSTAADRATPERSPARGAEQTEQSRAGNPLAGSGDAAAGTTRARIVLRALAGATEPAAARADRGPSAHRASPPPSVAFAGPPVPDGGTQTRCDAGPAARATLPGEAAATPVEPELEAGNERELEIALAAGHAGVRRLAAGRAGAPPAGGADRPPGDGQPGPWRPPPATRRLLVPVPETAEGAGPAGRRVEAHARGPPVAADPAPTTIDSNVPALAELHACARDEAHPAWEADALASTAVLQAKLAVSVSGDPFEREADAVAARVLRGATPYPPASRVFAGTLPRAPPRPAHSDPSVPRSVTGALQTGGGRPLDPALRARIEPHVGLDLGHVRVRGEPDAAAAARDLGARAFTSGPTIFLASGSSPADVALMAHEAAHVAQQASSPQARATLQRNPDVTDLIPDWILDGVRDAVRAIPGYQLLSTIAGEDLLTGGPARTSREELVEKLLTYGPFGAAVGPLLSTIDVLGDVFAVITEGLVANDLTLARIGRDIERAWDKFSITNGIAGNVAIVRRLVNDLLADVASFVGSIVERVLEIVRAVVAEVAEPLLASDPIGPVWELTKKVLHYDPLRGEEVQAETVDIIADFLRLIGEEQRLAQMQERGTLQQTADWLDTQLETFRGLIGELGALFRDAWAAIAPENLPNLLTNLESLAQRAFGFIGRVAEFGATLILKVLELVKDSLLGWLSEHAHAIPGFHLLTVILEQDPFTGEPVERTARNLIRGFITLMPGGAETFDQLAEAGVIDQAAERIESAMARLGISLELITGIFVGIWDELTLDDLLDPVSAFNRILALFGEPLGRLVEFAGVVIEVVVTLILRLLNFPSDLLGSVIANATQAIDDIAADPVGFLVNMVQAVKLGLSGFFDNILGHLTSGLVDWLFRGLGQLGIQPPPDFSLGSILTLVLQVLGLTVEHLWEKLGEHIGPERVAQIRGALDMLTGAWAFIGDVAREGLPAIWRYVSDQLSGLWDTLLGMAREWIMTRVVSAVTTRLLSLLDPTGVMAVVNSFIAFFNAVQSAIEYFRDILQIIAGYVETLAAVAAGNVAPGAQMLEQGLANAIPIAIGFLAAQVGLGNIPEKVVEIIGRLRELVDRALDWLIAQALRLGRAALNAVGIGRPADPDAATVDPTDHEAVATQVVGEMATASAAAADYPTLRAEKEAQARTIEQRYTGTLGLNVGLRINFTPAAAQAPQNDLDFEVVIAPNTTRKPGSVPAREHGIDPEPTGLVDFSTNRVVVRFTVLTYPPYEMSHSLQRHHYNFLNQEGGNPEAQNSLMYHDLEPDTAAADGTGVGRNIQGKLRRDLRSDIPVGDRYRVNAREFVVDSTTHFFVTSGAQVWGAVSRNAWIAARMLRRVERDAVSPAQVRRMVTARTRNRLIAGGALATDFEPPTQIVTTTAVAMGHANAYLGLGLVSGRADLVAAFRDLNRLEGR